MTTLTLANVGPLLEQFRGEGLMVSCYADFTTQQGFKANWRGPFKSKMHELKQMFADDHRAWQECEKNLQEIQQSLESSQNEQARGVAAFSAVQRKFFQKFTLDVPVENEIVVAESPYLVPLLMVLCQQREYLVVQTDTHRGSLFRASLGSVQLLQELQEDVPKRYRSTPESDRQTEAEAHRRDQILQYQKKLVQAIDKTWNERPYRSIILLGQHDITEQFRKKLPPRLASRVAQLVTHSWVDKPASMNGEIRNVLDNLLRTEESQMLAEFHQRIEEKRAVAAGPNAVLAALQNGQIGPKGHGYLLMGADPREVVARCTACRFLSLQMPDRCPRCAAETVEANFWEEILLLALRHDVVVVPVKTNDPVLARHEGIAAVLPWKAGALNVEAESLT